MSNLNTPSSSSTLWATASKEWVIQPKPKPGRKPKKDPPILPQDDAEVDIKGRRIQNRAAQRAFRERKQSQLSELQARIQLYEQGEIERNVALQNIAKRLKEENEKLRNENTALQEKLANIELRSQLPASQTINPVKKKRWRDDSPSSAVLPSQKKKSRASLQPPQHSISSSDTHLPSPSSMVSSPESSDAMDAHFPGSYDAQPDVLNRGSFDNFNNMTSEVKVDDVLSSFSSLGCGYCDGGAICLCHEISVHDVVERTIDSAVLKNNDFNGNIVGHNAQDTTVISPRLEEPAQGSILDNLPAYQPPLPLRPRRRSGGVPVNSIFPITSIAESSTMSATCSGDPSNCAACGDDAFGKAFCSAIGNTGPDICNNCPSQAPSTTTNSGCCGTGSCGNCPSASTFSSGGAMPNSQYVDSSEYIATNDAWKKLKAHPNVHFADLSLLAEVVASRSKCLGPQLQMTSQIPHSNDTSTRFTDIQSFTHQRGKSPPLQLVPQEVLLECGRRRMRHVHADGVKEALRLLDAKFS